MRDNPKRSLVILGMVAIVAVVTIVVLVLPPPSTDVDISSILNEENVAGQAISAIPPFGFSEPTEKEQFAYRSDQLLSRQASPAPMDAQQRTRSSRMNTK